ncbi:MAG: 2-oxo-4-hydroxy-4-carboxy-5-ureidoimidazoline decarboxylase [Hyphomicrobiaceae bacterium]|nr:MAG: 2-oxo-4-hydroxy-4-carboxy-5-ureidoimidazoline decarboxylase [Hyphomicrobiaceae bacterium]
MASPREAVERLDDSAPGEVLPLLNALIERSPAMAEKALSLRPFSTPAGLFRAIVRAMEASSPEERLALIRAHPDLAGAEAAAGTLTAASASEQSRLGLDRLTGPELARLDELKGRYRQRFGFPCIIALRRHASRESVLAAFEQRLGGDQDAEVGNALGEIADIVRGRISRHFGMTGWLSTHVLDTRDGVPGAGMAVELKAMCDSGWAALKATRTNSSGRTDEPLLNDIDMLPGAYRLEFDVAGYFRSRGVALADPPFLATIPIEFAIADAAAHYHVPLLVSPWSFSTYRGS